MITANACIFLETNAIREMEWHKTHRVAVSECGKTQGMLIVGSASEKPQAADLEGAMGLRPFFGENTCDMWKSDGILGGMCCRNDFDIMKVPIVLSSKIT